MRDPDGIHFNVDGGEWLAPVFLGGIRELMGLPQLPSNPVVAHVGAATGG